MCHIVTLSNCSCICFSMRLDEIRVVGLHISHDINMLIHCPAVVLVESVVSPPPPPKSMENVATSVCHSLLLMRVTSLYYICLFFLIPGVSLSNCMYINVPCLSPGKAAIIIPTKDTTN